ncbi:hypothetical protein TNIN_153171 [Trichonephila inaurata madagascariensis]|uniref:Uncharacterized protein n=1 Tax=Trichonephila inaurata madagascariensis TaxID=2747483 RepID=A0A8X6XVW2_9ARAC|nr:hypothetical protein TNIN_153171 [Trichonephila inaurata madagascariensis]
MEKGHFDVHDKNFNGTSGTMEIRTALMIWRQSTHEYQMRFVSLLNNCDSKSFEFLAENSIDGSDVKGEKFEPYCKKAGHILMQKKS